jgi:hypothetical protein
MPFIKETAIQAGRIGGKVTKYTTKLYPFTILDIARDTGASIEYLRKIEKVENIYINEMTLKQILKLYLYLNKKPWEKSSEEPDITKSWQENSYDYIQERKAKQEIAKSKSKEVIEEDPNNRLF